MTAEHAVTWSAPCPDGHDAVWSQSARDAVAAASVPTVVCDECTPEPVAPVVQPVRPRALWPSPAGPVAAWAKRTRGNA